MGPTSIKVIILLALMGGLGFFSYKAGYNSCETTYLKQVEEDNQKINNLIQIQRETENVLQDERDKKQQVVTRVVTRVKREIVNLPTRDCGLHADERLHLMDTYCASFPSSAECVPEKLSTGSTTTQPE